MSQQAAKIESKNASKDIIEEAPRQIGLPPMRQVSSPTNNTWPHWNSLFSQLNSKGFPIMKTPEELAQAGKDTINVLAKSSAALAEGCSDISHHVVELTHKSIAAHLTTSKEMLDIKTSGDWLEFQSKWAGDWMAATIQQMAHFSQLSTKVINQTCEPLKTHFGAAFSKMGNPYGIR